MPGLDMHVAAADAPLDIVDRDRLAVLAFVTDDASEQTLRGGLGEMAERLQIRRGDVFAATRALAKEPTPRVLIVDVSGIERPLEALDGLAAVCAPDVRLLLVGTRDDVAFYREMTRGVGALEYLFKPLTRDNVARLFGPAVIGSLPGRPVDRGGTIITVGGARGGVGATTIAVNLAVQLAEETHGHVALLDLNLRGGTAAMMLGVQPGAGLRLALEQPDRIDALLLDRLAVPVGDRLRLIAAEETFETDPAPTAEGIDRLLKLLQLRFNTIVVDLAMPPTGAERQVLANARQRVLVMAPEVASIRDAQAARRLVTAITGQNRMIVVLNRCNMAGGLPQALIKDGLESEPDVRIADMPRHLPRAANLGRPALHESPAFRRALRPLIQEIGGVKAPTRGASLLKRLGLRGRS